MEIWIGIFVWYIIGVCGHIYWVRAKYDYTTAHIGDSLFAGVIGPISFFVGWMVYGPLPSASTPRVLLRKR